MEDAAIPAIREAAVAAAAEVEARVDRRLQPEVADAYRYYPLLRRWSVLR
jgi:hypothetical protein